MHNFENDLCTTVDAILELLGHRPQVVREQYSLSQAYGQLPSRPHRIGDIPPPPPVRGSQTQAKLVSSHGHLEHMYPGV